MSFDTSMAIVQDVPHNTVPACCSASKMCGVKTFKTSCTPKANGSCLFARRALASSMKSSKKGSSSGAKCRVSSSPAMQIKASILSLRTAFMCLPPSASSIDVPLYSTQHSPKCEPKGDGGDDYSSNSFQVCSINRLNPHPEAVIKSRQTDRLLRVASRSPNTHEEPTSTPFNTEKATAPRNTRSSGHLHSTAHQTAITVTDFVTRYGSSASGPPSDP